MNPNLKKRLPSQNPMDQKDISVYRVSWTGLSNRRYFKSSSRLLTPISRTIAMVFEKAEVPTRPLNEPKSIIKKATES